MVSMRWISNNCGFGISDFGNTVKYLYFLQNIKDYISEIQHPISEIDSFRILRTILAVNGECKFYLSVFYPDYWTK